MKKDWIRFFTKRTLICAAIFFAVILIGRFAKSASGTSYFSEIYLRLDQLLQSQGSTPPAPGSGVLKVYNKSNILYKQDSAGNEKAISADGQSPNFSGLTVGTNTGVIQGTSGVLSALAAGVDGQVLTSDSTKTNGIAWENANAGSGSGGINIIQHPDFDAGMSTGWSATGGTVTAVTSGSNQLIPNLTTASFAASASSQIFESSATSVPTALVNTLCFAQIYYKYGGTSGDYSFQIDDGTGGSLAIQTLAASTGTNQVLPPFSCKPASGNVRVQIISNVSSPSPIYVGHAYVGEIRYPLSKGLTTSGGSPSSYSNGLLIQAPNATMTQASNQATLIETGNTNLLSNPSFEASSSISGWSLGSGVSSAVSTSTVVDGAQSIALTLSSVNGSILSQAVTPIASLQGSNIIVGAWVNAPSAASGLLQICYTLAGTSGGCQSINADGTWHFASTMVAAPSSGSIGILIQSTSSLSSTINVDGAFLGIPNPSVSFVTIDAMTDWVNAGNTIVSAVTTAPSKGTATKVADNMWWRRVGGNMEIRLEYKQTAAGTATAGSGDYLFQIPSGYQIDTSKITVYGGASIGAGSVVFPTNSVGSLVATYGSDGFFGGVFVYDSTHVRLGGSGFANTSTANLGMIGSATFGFTNASYAFTATFTVPILGWTSNSSAVSPLNANTDWVSMVPTFTGFGTVTIANANDCKEKRDGPDMLIVCKFTEGTETAVAKQMSLPNSLTVDSTKVPAIQVAGTCYLSTTGSTSQRTVLMTGGNSFLNFGIQDGSNGGLTAYSGSSFGSSSTISCFARVPISGWTENQKAPNLIGSVTSGSAGAMRMESLIFAGSTSTSSCTSSPCSTYQQSSTWFTNVTRTGTGLYTVNVPSGTFSGTPVCTTSTDNNIGSKVCQYLSDSSSATALNFETVAMSGVTPADAGCSIICMGPR